MSEKTLQAVWDTCDRMYDGGECFIGRKMDPTFIPLAPIKPVIIFDESEDTHTYKDGEPMAPKETSLDAVDQPMISFDACNDYMDFFVCMHRNGHMTYEAASLGVTAYQILEQE